MHQTQPNMIWSMMSSFLLTVLGVNGDCLAGKCQRISLDVYRDAVQDSEFVGHVFHNSVTLNPIQCYTWCIQDCRCLSLNYKENNDHKYCELNEGNHFTNKSSLKHSPGSRYYILFVSHQTHCERKNFMSLVSITTLFSCLSCYVIIILFSIGLQL